MSVIIRNTQSAIYKVTEWHRVKLRTTEQRKTTDDGRYVMGGSKYRTLRH